MFDRRSWIGRRFTDRRGTASFPYTADESDLIRRMVSEAVFEIACPRCMEPVQVPEPIIAGGSPVWEIQCEHCNCAATISSLSAAVMVVAADAMMRDALSLVLAKAGHQIFEASNGGAALRTYQRYAPDVVITDIYLDDMDGVDFTRRLLRFDSQAKVIAVAGPRRHGAPDPLATAKRLGATQILRKPFPPDDMLTMVNSVLRGD